MVKIRGSTIIITGGASGVGEAATRNFMSQGANIVIFDRNEKRGVMLTQELNKLHPENSSTFFKVDITSEVEVREALDQSLLIYGQIRGLVNCAGIGYSEKTVSRGGPHKTDTFDMVVKVNLYGTFNVSRLVAEVMSKQAPVNQDGERGVIVNIASVAAVEGQQGQIAYSASKGAVLAMTLPMARDLSIYGIRVMCISPGLIETPMTAPTSQKVRENIIGQVAFPHRMGTAHEVAMLAGFIIENEYLNGGNIRIDAG